MSSGVFLCFTCEGILKPGSLEIVSSMELELLKPPTIEFIFLECSIAPEKINGWKTTSLWGR